MRFPAMCAADFLSSATWPQWPCVFSVQRIVSFFSREPLDAQGSHERLV